jgi:hypothetical protein
MAEIKPEKAGDSSIETQNLLAMSEISLQLDTYDDIFSDFDPRPYTNRSLSIDFLEEAKRASRDLPFGAIELKFLIHNSVRSIGKEALIKKRLREHFLKHYNRSKREMNSVIVQGAVFLLVGIVLMFFASYMLFKGQTTSTLFGSFMLVLLEPAGWFFIWEGMAQIIFEAKEKRPNTEFYRKMSECRITFIPF